MRKLKQSEKRPEKGIVQKLVAVFLVIIFTIIASDSILTPVQASTTGNFNERINQLKQRFPQGKYWNHMGGATNSSNTVTSIPCTHHKKGYCSQNGYNGWCGCNSFDNVAIQCMGFAYKLGYEVFGTNPTKWTKSYNVNDIKAGDIIRYKNDGHSIFVTGVSGNTITYADCNSDGHCVINWDKTISKSNLTGFNYVLHASNYGDVNFTGSNPTQPDTCSCSTAYAGNYTVSTTEQPLTMRSGHGTGYSVVTSIPKGSQVSVSKSDGTWAHVEWNGYSGFCSMEYLKKIDNTNDIVAHIDEISGGVNSIKIKGWVFDRAIMSRHVEVHVYIGGPAGSGAPCYIIKADKFHQGVQDAYGSGEYHGIDEEIATDKIGEQSVFVYAITPETNANPQICDGKIVNIISDREGPIISNISISDVSSQGYTVNCQVTDSVGVNRVQFPTWTEYNGQDDLLPNWNTESAASGIISGNRVSFRVDTSSHNNETGTYITHIYAWDNANNITSNSSVKIVLNNGLIPSAVVYLKGHIYAAFDEPYSWKEAEALCESMGGHLATITSKEENDFIKSMPLGFSYYIGASDEQTEGVWKWVTGENFSYSNWAKGQPDNANEEDFGMFYSDGTWNDSSGVSSLYTGFILEIDDMGTPVSSITDNGSVYEIYDVSVPWEIAEAYCEMKGGTLACITSEKEEKTIEQLIDKGKKINYQLGATDKEEEGNWKWITGESMSYNLWTQGEPNNRSSNEALGPENYLTFIRANGWYDMKSFPGNSGFILEKKEDLAVSGKASESNIKKGDKVIIDAAASGGKGSYTYNYLVHNKDTNESSCLVSSFIGSSSYTWTAVKAGSYEFFIEVKDSTGAIVRSSAITVEVTEPLSITGKISTSTAAINSKVVVNGIASGGSGNYTYSYLLHNKDTNQWSRLTPSFVSGSSYTWTAGSTGNREFFIEVKDSTGIVVRSSALNVKVANSLSITGRTNASEAAVGSKVIISGTASGGNGNYTYSYLVHNKDTNAWSRLTSSFINKSSYIWVAGSAGKREFFVEVKDSTGKVVRSNAVDVNIKAFSPLKISGKANVTSVIVGNKVIISGTASGGNGGYTYSYLVHNKDTNAWSRLTSNFVTANSYTWNAGSAGNREFFVEVKDSTGKVVRSNAINVKTEKKPATLTVIAGATSSQVSVGQKIMILGTGNGGTGNYTYSYLVHNKDTNAWSRLTPSFVTNNTYTWTAGSAGNREFFVEVKDSAGKIVRSKAVNIIAK